MSNPSQPVTKQSQAFPPANAPVVVAEKIVESRNLFLTSDNIANATGNGQNCTWNFGNDAIVTRSPAQYIRLTLLNFNMYKTWTNVNILNNLVQLQLPGALNNYIQLDAFNYSTIHDVAQNFGDKLKAAFDTHYGLALTLAVNSPPPGAIASGTTNNIISVTLTDGTASGALPAQADVTSGAFTIACPIDTLNYPVIVAAGIATSAQGGDSAILLGGDRIASTDPAGTQSFIVSCDPALNYITINGIYPAQRFTEPNVYMRVNPAPSTSASANFEKVQTSFIDPTKHNNNPSASPILAEIKQQDEMVQYTSPGSGDFFANFYMKTLNSLQLQLTDSRNREFPVYSANQTSRGNRYFTCNFRADIVMDTAYGETPDPQAQQVYLPHKFPPRFDSNILVNQPRASNYGRSPAY